MKTPAKKKSVKVTQRVRQWTNNDIMRALTADHDRIEKRQKQMEERQLHDIKEVRDELYRHVAECHRDIANRIDNIAHNLVAGQGRIESRLPAPEPKEPEPRKFKKGDWVCLIKNAEFLGIVPKDGSGYHQVQWKRRGDSVRLMTSCEHSRDLRPASKAEIDAHLEAERKAEEASLPIVFGTRVEYQQDRGWRIAIEEVFHKNEWLICKGNRTQWVKRHEFTVISPKP